jgi:hypothetical protein
MNKPEQKRKLVGPWRNLHAAIWMIGLAILFWRGWWWPGILVLVAVSSVLEGVLMQFAPHAFEKEELPPSQPPAPPAPPSAPVQAIPEQRFETLPSICPRCGAPVREQDVKWTGARSANCSYCGANLPVRKD